MKSTTKVISISLPSSKSCDSSSTWLQHWYSQSLDLITRRSPVTGSSWHADQLFQSVHGPSVQTSNGSKALQYKIQWIFLDQWVPFWALSWPKLSKTKKLKPYKYCMLCCPQKFLQVAHTEPLLEPLSLSLFHDHKVHCILHIHPNPPSQLKISNLEF